jgi:hypothetical protein
MATKEKSPGTKKGKHVTKSGKDDVRNATKQKEVEKVGGAKRK